MKSWWALCLATNVFCAGIGKGSFAEEAIQHYKFGTSRIISSATTEDCNRDANELARTILHADKNIVRAFGRCLGTSIVTDKGDIFTAESLAVDYDSKGWPLSPYQAKLTPTFNPFDSVQAMYPTLRSCVNDVSEQRRIFESATQTILVSAVCGPEGDISEFGFVLKMEGIGEPRRRLFHVTNRAYGHTDQYPTWGQKMIDVINQQGGTLAKKSGEDFFYYAKSEIQMTGETLISARSLDECEIQKAEAHALLKKAEANIVVIECRENPISKFSMDLIADMLYLPANDYGFSDQIYYSFKECMANLDVARTVAKQKGQNVFGAFCVPSSARAGAYRIALFLR